MVIEKPIIVNAEVTAISLVINQTHRDISELWYVCLSLDRDGIACSRDDSLTKSAPSSTSHRRSSEYDVRRIGHGRRRCDRHRRRWIDLIRGRKNRRRRRLHHWPTSALMSAGRHQTNIRGRKGYIPIGEGGMDRRHPTS